MLIRWDQESSPATVTGERWVTMVEEIDAFLDELTATAQTEGIPMDAMLSVSREPGEPRLMVIVGVDRVPLYWPPSDALSRGSEGTDPLPEFEFLRGGHSAFPAWSVIPIEQAREAARLFFTFGGRRPENITWDETTP